MVAFFPDSGLGFICLIRSNKIFCKGFVYNIQTCMKSMGIIGRTVLSKQILQNIYRNICSNFYFTNQIFSNNLPAENIIDFFVKSGAYFSPKCSKKFSDSRFFSVLSRLLHQ